MLLFDLQEGMTGVIVRLMGTGAFRKRLMEMGFVPGQVVTVMKKAPLKDPVEYNVMGYNVSIRNEEAKHIEICTVESYLGTDNRGTNGSFSTEEKRSDINIKKNVNVVLVGNPNAGKTTLFNLVSGLNERVGNYGGVTVSAKEGTFVYNGYRFNIIDLPGTYSITAYTPEEVFVRDYITEHHPDVVVNVVDASNLERNLYLTTQLIDMDIKVVIALNMYDELLEKKDLLDYNALGKLLGIPIVPTVSHKNKGIDALFDKITEVFSDKDPVTRHIHINYGEVVEQAIGKIQEKIKIFENLELTNHISPRFMAIKLIEGDKEIFKKIQSAANAEEIVAMTKRESEKLKKNYPNEAPEDIITKAKFGFIAGALKETYNKGKYSRKTAAEFFDWLFTHRYFGYPVFFFFMWLTFTLTFTLGEYPMSWIESGFENLASVLSERLPQGALTDLLINGIISGVGGVVVFLPNILLLFFFISLMEDTGYMARAVFIMDKLMHKMGLHGKSFIPLIMGFGCNVPAIMATRTIENRNDRLLTMLINPFMSCSARLPVYVLFISAFFPDNRGNLLFGIYLLGVLTAALVALLFKRILFRKKEAPFVMELPPFRMPTQRSTFRGMWSKGVEYLKKISSIILISSVIIWGFSHYPVKKDFDKDYEKEAWLLESSYAKRIMLAEESQEDFLLHEKDTKLHQLEAERSAELLEYSLLGRIGRFIEPVIKPLGFDWKMGIALLSGAPAKEIIVSTLSVLYQSEELSENNVSLIDKLKAHSIQSGNSNNSKLSPLTALTFMVFVLLYFPCIGTLVVISRESGSWKWGLFAAIYTTVIAWIAAFAIYNVGGLF